MNPGVAVAKARMLLDRLVIESAGVHDPTTQRAGELILDLLHVAEQQQLALEALHDRLQQHFNGGGADHPDIEVKT